MVVLSGKKDIFFLPDMLDEGRAPMPTERRPGDTPIPLAVGLVLLPILCCGLPVLIGAGVLGGLAGWLINPWMITITVLAVAGIVVALVRRRKVTDRHH